MVGESGSVLAVDIATDLLALAAASAAAQGLHNIEFRTADVTTLTGTGTFDAVSCAFGVFFLPGMDDAVRTLLSHLRPGGRFAFTVWHADALYAFTRAFFDSLATVDASTAGPAGGDEPHPITTIDTEEKIRTWAASLGGKNLVTTVLPLRVPRSEEFCWGMALGSGLRGALLDLGPGEMDLVRATFLQTLADRGIDDINCDSLIVSGTT
jgi:SAM-dependent methyltransferase